jgi:hypothetical protein
MATKGETDDIYCDLCQGRHITKQAEEYCLRCEEALCAFSLTGGNTSFITNNVMRRTMELRNIAMIITVLFNLLNKKNEKKSLIS